MVKELAAFAKLRGVTIIGEMDVPTPDQVRAENHIVLKNEVRPAMMNFALKNDEFCIQNDQEPARSTCSGEYMRKIRPKSGANCPSAILFLYIFPGAGIRISIHGRQWDLERVSLKSTVFSIKSIII